MNWSRSYSSTWRIFAVNPDTWADGEELGKVDAVSVERTADGSLLESGSMDVTDSFEPGYYRIVLTAEQDSDIERVEVATLLFNATSGNYNYGTSSHSAEGYSVLYPASTTVMLSGSYAPAGVDGAQYVADLLTSAINAPVVVDGSFTLNDYVIHEFGHTVLEAAWNVLNAGNFVLQIDGHGTVHILPRPSTSSLSLAGVNVSYLQPGIDYELDDSAVPNRYIAVNGRAQAVAVNDSVSSSVSTINRGYTVDVVDTEPVCVNGETLRAYATRKLRELSTVADTRSYTREFFPGVNVYDLVDAGVDGMNGILRVVQQSLTCNYGITVTEQSSTEVNLWV